MLGSVFLEFGKGTSLGTNSHRFVIMFRLSTLLLQETCLSKKDLAPEYFEQKTNLYVLMKKKRANFMMKIIQVFQQFTVRTPRVGW